MRIQNRNMAGGALTLRYSRDAVDPAKPRTVVGDADGVFEVPERDAEMLVKTKGWRKAPKTKKPEVETAEEPAESPDEPGPNVDGLRSKADAQAMAEEWRAKGFDIPEFAEGTKLADMKASLNSTIYGEVA